HYLVALNVEDAVWRMERNNGRGTQLLTYAFWTVLALVGKSLQKGGVVWGKEGLNALLENQDKEWEKKWSKGWLRLVKSVFAHTRKGFRAAQVAARKRREDLTAANFFKSEKHVNGLIAQYVRKAEADLARRALHGRI